MLYNVNVMSYTGYTQWIQNPIDSCFFSMLKYIHMYVPTHLFNYLI